MLKSKDVEKLKARDVMKEDVVCVGHNAPVEEALELMLLNKISGVPVVKKDMTLLGVVTEKDLIRLLLGDHSIKGKKVEEFMTQPAVFFEEHESLIEVCNCLNDVTFRRVPVTREGKVVGIVSRPDIIKCILEFSDEKIVLRFMKVSKFLRILNPVLVALFLSQAITGLFHDKIPEDTFVFLHVKGGILFIIIIIVHFILNFHWIKAHYFHKWWKV